VLNSVYQRCYGILTFRCTGDGICGHVKHHGFVCIQRLLLAFFMPSVWPHDRSTLRSAFGRPNITLAIMASALHEIPYFAGALVAAFVGTSNIMASYAFGGLLLAFFVSSSGLTRFSGSFKKKYDAEHKKGGQRNWVQVLCNGGLPSVLALLYLYVTASGHAPFLHGCGSYSCSAFFLWRDVSHAVVKPCKCSATGACLHFWLSCICM
jgi:hypothetical protein